jgi:transglutaminase-like putative cysteine protease
VRRIDDHTAEVVIRRVDGRAEPAEEKLPPPGEEFTRATRFLQCGDAEVRRQAEAGAAGETDPLRVALRLERSVRDLVTDKNFSTALASAAEVARSREGDCTEHAVLLAALLRCRGIPSRVAAGLVYVESLEGFGGHMWTEAFIGGRWIPLDATLGRGGAGPAHIKLADSSLADNAPAPVTAFAPLIKLLGGAARIEVIRAE